MRKSIIFCLCVAVVAMFSACKDPEGVYNPSKKIQKIYTVDEDGVKELAETWNWNGDLLTSIDYYDYDGTVAYTNQFTYDTKDRLVAIEGGGVRNELIYDGKYIQKIVTTAELDEETGLESGEVAVTEFEHEKGKISVIKMDFSIFDDLDFGWKIGMMNPLRLMLPEVCSVVESALKKCSKEAKGQLFTMKLNWKGNNVSSMDITYDISFDGYEMTVTQTSELTYDNKNNPMYGLFASMSSDGASNIFLNKNNPVTVKNLYLGQVLGTTDYTYEYDGNYPTKVTVKSVEDEYIDVNTIIYEY